MEARAGIVTSRVVIAEDEAIIRMDLREMLEEEGFEVVGEAFDGKVAIDLAREHRPDICILDIKMPGMDGIRAAEVITRERIAPVLILTAFSQRDLAHQAAQAGAMAYLVKPFQKSDLLPAIEVALERYGEVTRLEGEVAELADRLEARKLVERAKGVLMDQGLGEAEAYRLMQRAAMDRSLRIDDVAKLIIEGKLGESEGTT
ncbi:MAG TPA: response regulator [Actinomycetota bacterium]|jgi:response regulator NasT|nr:response regulator [Actinomycetota bacterium]